RAFGVQIDNATTTEEALSKIGKGAYDLVISGMVRHQKFDAGLELLHRLRRSRTQTPVVNCVGFVYTFGGTPPRSFGIAVRPEAPLHYVFDVLERARV